MCLIILEITHIDYTKNQYDIDTYLNKYSDRNEDMPIDTYTSSNELHYKIWCIEGGKYSRETWYRLMVVSLNQEYVELLDEILKKMAKKFVRPILTCIRSFAMPDGMSCGRQYEPNLQGYFQSHT